MNNKNIRMPKAGERWSLLGYAETVIITGLYYPEAICPAHFRPDVKFTNELTGQPGSMALKAFLLAYIPGIRNPPGYRNNDWLSDDKPSRPLNQEKKGTAGSVERWKEKDSRRFSHYDK